MGISVTISLFNDNLKMLQPKEESMRIRHIVKSWHLRSWMIAGLSAFILQVAASGMSLAAVCPAATVADDKGIKGAYPQRYELAEFESQAK